MAIGPNSRFTTLIIGAIIFISVVFFLNPTPNPKSPKDRAPGHIVESTDHDALLQGGGSIRSSSSRMLEGPVVMPKLGNATVKAELGRSTWRLLHTMMARFPEKPTEEEQETLRAYIYLFSRLYPCGECAIHFQHMLKSYPPQVSSRNAAAAWACDMHNKVNKKLRKPMFNCVEIGDFYDCGCADHGEDGEQQHDGGKSQQPAGKSEQQQHALSAKKDEEGSKEPFSIHPEPQTLG